MPGFQEVAALVVFIITLTLVVVLVLRPVFVPIPRTSRRFHVSYAWVPIVGVLVMVACGSLAGADLVRGMVGDEHIKPYGVLILFMALAYMSAALDATGLFAYLALRIAAASGGRCRALFIAYFSLASVVTTFTSNDVTTMALTPIVHEFVVRTGAPPLPFLAAVFAASNVWSLLLYVGNPTNIIVAQAFAMSFLGYTAWMALPCLAAGAACLAVLLVSHLPRIPSRLELPPLQPAAALLDAPGAAFGAALLLACLALLAAASYLGWEMWAITLVTAGLHAGYNVVAYEILGPWRRRRQLAGLDARRGGGGGDEGESSHGLGRPGEVDGGCSGGRGGAGCGGQAGDGSYGVVVVGCGGAGEGVSAGGGSGAGVCAAPMTDRCRSAPAAAAAAAPRGVGAGLGAGAGGCGAGDVVFGASLTGPGAADQGAGCAAAAAHVGDGAPGSTMAHAAAAAASGGAARRQLCNGGGQGGRPSAPTCSLDSDAVISLSAEVGSTGGGGSSGGGAADGDPAAHGGGGTGGGGRSKPVAPAPGDAEVAAVPPPRFLPPLLQLPWEVVPFVLGMFIQVEALALAGWLDALGTLLGAGAGSVGAALFTLGAVTVLLSQAASNQPVTILLTRACMSSSFAAATGGGPRLRAALFALVVGSNTAANFTVIGALAGIMWRNILARRGLHVTYTQFLVLLAPSGVASTVAALLVLWAEFAVMGGH